MDDLDAASSSLGQAICRLVEHRNDLETCRPGPHGQTTCTGIARTICNFGSEIGMGGLGGSLSSIGWSCNWERMALLTVAAMAHESVGDFRDSLSRGLWVARTWGGFGPLTLFV